MRRARANGGIGKVFNHQWPQNLCNWLQHLQHRSMQVWCFLKLIRVLGLEKHRHLIQMGESGCADLCINMKEPSAPCHKQEGGCLSAGRHFSSQGSPGWFFGAHFFLPSEQWFMFWCSAMNLDCLCLRVAGWRMNVDQSQGWKSEDPQTLKQTRSAVVFFPLWFTPEEILAGR